MRTLWVTSFNPEIWNLSGQHLVESFVKTRTRDALFCAYEAGTAPWLQPADRPEVIFESLDGANSILKPWLTRFAGRIPMALGGNHSGNCECPGGPLPVHAKTHKMPCIGHWFCRHAARWYRKIAALDLAMQFRTEYEGTPGAFDVLVWIDADCSFLHTVGERDIKMWLGSHAGFYLRSKRPVMEAGVFGIYLRRGRALLDELMRRYRQGLIFADERWDDSFQIQIAMRKLARSVPMRDLARSVEAHSDVITTSLMGKFVAHDKGRHSRKTGLFT